MKDILGYLLCLISALDLLIWIKRDKRDREAIWNGLADMLIIIYVLI